MSTLPRDIRAVRAIKQLLLAIDGTGAYFNALPEANIVCGRVAFPAEQRPAVGINEENSDYPDKKLTRSSELIMLLHLDLFAVLDPSAPGESAMFFRADVKRALTPNGLRKLVDADGEIASFTIGPFESLSSGRSTDIEGYSITLEINMTETLGNPAA